MATGNKATIFVSFKIRQEGLSVLDIDEAANRNKNCNNKSNVKNNAKQYSCAAIAISTAEHTHDSKCASGCFPT